MIHKSKNCSAHDLIISDCCGLGCSHCGVCKCQEKSEKEKLNLAPHEWASLYEQMKPIIDNGGNSIRHLEGCMLILVEAVEKRINI